MMAIRAKRALDNLQTNIEALIEHYYNCVRLHSGLGYRSPEAFKTLSPRNPQRELDLLLGKTNPISNKPGVVLELHARTSVPPTHREAHSSLSIAKPKRRTSAEMLSCSGVFGVIPRNTMVCTGVGRS